MTSVTTSFGAIFRLAGYAVLAIGLAVLVGIGMGAANAETPAGTCQSEVAP